MSVTSRPPRVTPEPGAAAGQLAEASLVRIFTRQDGDALAAGGILAQALTAQGTAFHLAPTRSRAERARRLNAGDDRTITVAIGEAEGADITLVGVHTTAAAAEVVRALDGTPPQALALAGTLAGGNQLAEAEVPVTERRTDRFGTPTPDPVAGLAHSLWVHAPFSGTPDRVETFLKEVGLSPTDVTDGEAMTRLRSRLAVVGSRPETDGSVESLRRLVAPHDSPGPFPTIEGFADVLAVLAGEAPGLATSLVVGGDVGDAAVTEWKRQAQASHRCLETGETERYGGLFVIFADGGPVRTIATTAARLLSPEPVTLVIGAEETAVVARSDASVRAVTAAITDATGGTSDGTKHRGVITHTPVPDRDQIVSIARDVL